MYDFINDKIPPAAKRLLGALLIFAVLCIGPLAVNAGAWPTAQEGTASAAQMGSVPGQYPPVYPLKRPSYGVDPAVRPLTRPPLGSVKIAWAERHGGVLKNDGTIEWMSSGGASAAMQTAQWKDIVDFAVGFEYQSSGRYDCTIALDKDGRVYALTGATDASVTAAVAAINDPAPANPWQQGDVVQVQCGGGHFLALKSNGTVLAAGRNTLGQITGANGLTGIVKIAAQETASMLLKYDGSLTAIGKNSTNSANYDGSAGWLAPNAANPIVDMCVERHNLCVLRADGTVENANSGVSPLKISDWKAQDVVQIVAADSAIVGLKSDGSTIGFSNYPTRCIVYTPTGSQPRAYHIYGGFCGTSALMENGAVAGASHAGYNDSGFTENMHTQLDGQASALKPMAFITANVAPGKFVSPFTLRLSAGANTVRYNLTGETVTTDDTAYPADGLLISDTASITAAVEYGGTMVGQQTFAYVKTDVPLDIDGAGFAVTFDGGEEAKWSKGTVVTASAAVTGLDSGEATAFLVLSVTRTDRQEQMCRSLSRITVGRGKTVTAETSLTLPELPPDGRYQAKAFFINGFSMVRPISIMVTK